MVSLDKADIISNPLSKIEELISYWGTPSNISRNITNYIAIKNVNYILRILGAYGIIQILAQDMGLKTGYVQRELVQSKIIQFLIFSGTAFALTNDISQAIIGTLLYFILKYSVSNNHTSSVCFERI